MDTLLLDAAGSADTWRDPQWQHAFGERLAAAHSGILIQDAAGNDILRASSSGPGPRGGWEQGSGQRVVVVEGGQRVGSVTLFTPWSAAGSSRPATMIGLVLAFACVFWQLRRFIVRPLEALGRAARRIAGGDLDFTLPHSPVREVAAVCEAFDAMGAGLRDSIGRQAALEEERRFFVGAIAHDLRTPLFALRGYLVGLEQGPATAPDRAARYITLARQRADHLDRLVSDLFTYTQVDCLEQTLYRTRLDLGPLLAGAVDGFMPRAMEKGITLRGEEPGALCEPREPCEIAGDAHLLERVIENLLDNALRHTSPGGEITVRWQADVVAGQATFTVTDTGPGIAPHDLPHLFEPLYRGETSRNRATGGAGLGLTIARRIVRAHGGDLTAANLAGGGAVFTGWLPLAAHPTKDLMRGPSPPCRPSVPGSRPFGGGRGRGWPHASGRRHARHGLMHLVPGRDGAGVRRRAAQVDVATTEGARRAFRRARTGGGQCSHCRCRADAAIHSSRPTWCARGECHFPAASV